jgi:HSP20 family protein
MNPCDCPTENTLLHEAGEAVHRPQFRINENDTGTRVLVALPGVRKEDLKLTLLEGSLQIEARRDQKIPEGWKTHRDPGAVRCYGLTLQLAPRLDGSQTTAALEAGVLTLQVPLREEAKPRQIHVN